MKSGETWIWNHCAFLGNEGRLRLRRNRHW